MENIEVKCIKGNTKLLKGAIYEINKIDETYGRRYYIDGINCYFNINHLEPTDKTIDLLKVPCFDNSKGGINDYTWQNRLSNIIKDYNESKITDIEKIKKDIVGQIVKCGGNSTKYLVKGNFYTITDAKIANPRWSNQLYLDKVKINNGRGSWYSTSHFFMVNKKIQRKLKLNKLTTGSNITKLTRKFEAYSERAKMALIFQIISDICNDLEKAQDISNVNFEDMIIQKGNKHNIIKEDLKDYKLIIQTAKKKIL